MIMDKVNIALSVEEVNFVLYSLGKLPYDQVSGLIEIGRAHV